MAIPNPTVGNHHIGDVLEDIKMGMNAEDFTHLAFMFENQYSRPIDAVVREYSTNAWDSHVDAGVTRPIEVTLPTAESLEFVVQDFGLGMSIDTLREVYSMYGASTKRGSNAVAGQLGIGSKSALSYATLFTITAVRNGVKVSAYSTKDEHGLGVIKISDTCGTDEPNGVRIGIPVERWDVDRFREAAEGLFQFWEPGTVLIDGEAPEVPAWRETALRLDDDTWLINDDADLYDSYVIMGNVPYPVDDADLGVRGTRRFVARLNIGDVDFAPSREDVRHTNWTDETLSDLTEYIKGAYKRAIAKRLTEVTTRWDEAMLKVLWMDRNLSIRGSVNSPIWNFDPNGYGRKANRTFVVRLNTLAHGNIVVITDFPNKSVSTVARDRLTDFATDKGLKVSSFVIFPEAAHTGVLEGRPHTFTWDEVAGATEVPKAQRKALQKQAETRYQVLGAAVPTMTAAELAQVSGTVLYLEPHLRYTHGNLDSVVVMLRSSNQVNRLKRLVPGITPYHTEKDRRTKAAEAAVTDEDRKIMRARTLPDVYHGLKPEDVIDPELADALRLRKMSDTPTLAEAKHFNIEVKGGSVSKMFKERYPLLHSGGYYTISLTSPARKADALLYINAKFDALTAPAAEVAS